MVLLVLKYKKYTRRDVIRRFLQYHALISEMIDLRRPLDDSASAAGTILKIALHLYELYEKGVIVSGI